MRARDYRGNFQRYFISLCVCVVVSGCTAALFSYDAPAAKPSGSTNTASTNSSGSGAVTTARPDSRRGSTAGTDGESRKHGSDTQVCGFEFVPALASRELGRCGCGDHNGGGDGLGGC